MRIGFLQKVRMELDMDELHSSARSTLQLNSLRLCKNAIHTHESMSISSITIVDMVVIE